MDLVDVVLDVHDRLDAGDVPHAFGGALALGYVADPRATVNVDVNVFVDVAEVDAVLDLMAHGGLTPERDRGAWMPSAGIRLRRPSSPHPVDVFPSLDDAVYAEVRQRARRWPFGPDGRTLPFLSAEDLVLFKLSFNRPKDWVDLQAIADARTVLDVEYVERQLLALRGDRAYPRVARMQQLLRRR